MKRPLPLFITPQAEEEAQEAARWYQQESEGLGTTFLETVERALSQIEENPLRFPVIHRGIRRAVLGRFPYGIFFRTRPDRIKVIAILHLARDPILWRRRR
jgi:toxin ParE1/3/4